MNFPVLSSWSVFGWIIWLGYLLLAVWFVHSRRQLTPPRGAQRLEHALVGALLLLHAPLAFLPIAASQPFFGAGEALGLLTWLATLIYWSASFMVRLNGLQPVLMPVAAACLAVSLLLPAGRATPWLSAPLMQAHFAIAMLAYGFLAVSAGLAILIRLANQELHRRDAGLLRQLPPLLTLESLLFSTMALGFVLLTATLLTGIVFSEQLFGRAMAFSHKTVFSIAAWLVFGGLLLGRHTRGWRGRLAINWTLTGFALLLLAYIGSSFVMEVILHRTV